MKGAVLLSLSHLPQPTSPLPLPLSSSSLSPGRALQLVQPLLTSCALPLHRKMMMRQQKAATDTMHSGKRGREQRAKRDKERMRAIALFYALLPHICSSPGSTMSLSRPLPPSLHLSLFVVIIQRMSHPHPPPHPSSSTTLSY